MRCCGRVMYLQITQVGWTVGERAVDLSTDLLKAVAGHVPPLAVMPCRVVTCSVMAGPGLVTAAGIASQQQACQRLVSPDEGCLVMQLTLTGTA
jgi:hypothetical protein